MITFESIMARPVLHRFQVFRIAILSLFGFLLFSCSDDDPLPPDPLEATHVLGIWEINFREINGISPLVVVCCEFITLEADENTQDLTGTFSFRDDFSENEGTFTVDTANETIIFDLQTRNLIYSFTLSASLQTLTFEYEEEDASYREDWVRISKE